MADKINIHDKKYKDFRRNGYQRMVSLERQLSENELSFLYQNCKSSYEDVLEDYIKQYEVFLPSLIIGIIGGFVSLIFLMQIDAPSFEEDMWTIIPAFFIPSLIIGGAASVPLILIKARKSFSSTVKQVENYFDVINTRDREREKETNINKPSEKIKSPKKGFKKDTNEIFENNVRDFKNLVISKFGGLS